MSERRARAARIGRVVGGVLRQAAEDAGVAGLLVEEDWTPEGELVYEWAVQALGEERVWRAASGRPGLRTHPANKTVLLLAPVAAPLLPLGDLYASQVEALVGSWSGPADVEELARRAGGIEPLDAALARWLDGGEPPEQALAKLDAGLAAEITRRIERSRPARWRPGLVPKLGGRTIGIDLFE